MTVFFVVLQCVEPLLISRRPKCRHCSCVSFSSLTRDTHGARSSRTRNSFAWLYDVIQMLIVTMIVLIYWPWSVSLAFQLAFLEQLQVELVRVLKLREKKWYWPPFSKVPPKNNLCSHMELYMETRRSTLVTILIPQRQVQTFSNWAPWNSFLLVLRKRNLDVVLNQGYTYKWSTIALGTATITIRSNLSATPIQAPNYIIVRHWKSFFVAL